MHFAIIIRDKHHKNYSHVGYGFINALAQSLANVHRCEVTAIKYYDKSAQAGKEVFKPAMQINGRTIG